MISRRAFLGALSGIGAAIGLAKAKAEPIAPKQMATFDGKIFPVLGSKIETATPISTRTRFAIESINGTPIAVGNCFVGSSDIVVCRWVDGVIVAEITEQA